MADLLYEHCALVIFNYLQTPAVGRTRLCASGTCAAATALGVSRLTLSSLLNGKAGLSGDTALRIERAFGVKRYTLMRMQSAYEIAQTRKREKLIRVRRVLSAA